MRAASLVLGSAHQRQDRTAATLKKEKFRPCCPQVPSLNLEILGRFWKGRAVSGTLCARPVGWLESGRQRRGHGAAPELVRPRCDFMNRRRLSHRRLGALGVVKARGTKRWDQPLAFQQERPFIQVVHQPPCPWRVLSLWLAPTRDGRPRQSSQRGPGVRARPAFNGSSTRPDPSLRGRLRSPAPRPLAVALPQWPGRSRALCHGPSRLRHSPARRPLAIGAVPIISLVLTVNAEAQRACDLPRCKQCSKRTAANRRF
jgi:hypothetical protein